ncbi:MAG TPA: RecX family transcriptional regulator [Abditibacteriaceae bacterium]
MARTPFPGRISAVVAQEKLRRNLGRRVNVFIDGRFSFALDAGLAMDKGLRPDLVLDEAALEALIREDGDARAYARALHFLGYRARSAAEIVTRLKRDEWPEEVIERVIKRLQREKLVDDANFATLWVEHRSFSRPRGAYALRQELRQKGVENESIEAALPDAEQEVENAVEALRRKLYLWANLDERARRDKAIQFLKRRGFGFSVAKAALTHLDEERDE